MHVCLVSEAHTVHAQRWALGLHEAGLKVTLLTPTPCDEQLPCRVIIMPLYNRHMLTCWQNLVAARKLLRELSPDVIHLHGLFPLQSVRTVWFASQLPAPLVVSTWGSDIDPLEGGNGPVASWVRRYLLAKADRITSTSRFLAERTRLFSPPGKEIDVVPFGVENNISISPRQKAPPYVIGFFKGYAPIYGVDVLLRAAAQLRQRGRDDFRLEMIGQEEQADSPMKLAKVLGVEDIITWMDFLPRTALLERIRYMYVTVVPSRKESFGVAALESQLLGVPVVAANVGGLPETVVNGETGILFPPGDADALADALERLLSDPDTCRKMGEKGQHFVLQHYSWGACIQKMIDIYEDIKKE